jgi:histidinol-phosphate aminotransferase
MPGEQPKLAKLVKLNTNENPLWLTPQLIAPCRPSQTICACTRPLPPTAPAAVADYYGVQPAQVIVGNGSR